MLVRRFLNLSKVCLSLPLVLVAFQSGIAQAGNGKEGHGGFTYSQANRLLQRSLTQLSEWIPAAEAEGLTAEQKQEILEIVRSVQFKAGVPQDGRILFRPDEERIRDGQRLMFDYDLPGRGILVLKDFYAKFANLSDVEMEMKVTEVMRRILHEISHLWRFSEEEAAEFSRVMIQTLGAAHPSLLLSEERTYMMMYHLAQLETHALPRRDRDPRDLFLWGFVRYPKEEVSSELVAAKARLIDLGTTALPMLKERINLLRNNLIQKPNDYEIRMPLARAYIVARELIEVIGRIQDEEAFGFLSDLLAEDDTQLPYYHFISIGAAPLAIHGLSFRTQDAGEAASLLVERYRGSAERFTSDQEKVEKYDYAYNDRLRDRLGFVQSAISSALIRLGQPKEVIIEICIRLLSDPRSALGHGPNECPKALAQDTGKAGIDALIEVLKDPDLRKEKPLSEGISQALRQIPDFSQHIVLADQLIELFLTPYDPESCEIANRGYPYAARDLSGILADQFHNILPRLQIAVRRLGIDPIFLRGFPVSDSLQLKRIVWLSNLLGEALDKYYSPYNTVQKSPRPFVEEEVEFILRLALWRKMNTTLEDMIYTAWEGGWETKAWYRYRQDRFFSNWIKGMGQAALPYLYAAIVNAKAESVYSSAVLSTSGLSLEKKKALLEEHLADLVNLVGEILVPVNAGDPGLAYLRMVSQDMNRGMELRTAATQAYAKASARRPR